MDTTLEKFLPIRRAGHSQVKSQKQSSVHVPESETGHKVSEDEELSLLREFDLDSTFGPIIGVSRLDRWKRAQKFGLSPPPHVLQIVNQHSNDSRYTECVWKVLE